MASSSDNRNNSESLEESLGKQKITTTRLVPGQRTISILSWNLDGLDEEDLKERTDAVIEIVQRENYDVLAFQELRPFTYADISTQLLSRYEGIPGADPLTGYHTGTFLNKFTVSPQDHYIVAYPNSTMARTLLVTKFNIGQVKMALLNTHLESLRDHSEERKAQLKKCFQVAQSFPPDYNVLFGGDLNVRDWEVANMIPNDMCDLWAECGSWPSSEFTWDLTKNTNKQFETRRQPRFRFDRFYFRKSFPPTLNPTYFGLTGKEIVEGTNSFPSDHFGIVLGFRLAEKSRKVNYNRRKR